MVPSRQIGKKQRVDTSKFIVKKRPQKSIIRTSTKIQASKRMEALTKQQEYFVAQEEMEIDNALFTLAKLNR